MNLTIEYFGKNHSILENDVKKALNLNGQPEKRLKESLVLEYKSIPHNINANNFFSTTSIKQDELIEENQIIKPLVSFLNSQKGQGLLLLGIKEMEVDKNKVPSSLDPVIGYFETKLKDIINTSIFTFPKVTNSFNLNVIPVPISKNSENEKENNIFIIEIERLDDYVVYYSKKSGVVYQRQNDRSIELGLSEIFSLLQTKSIPRIFVHLDPQTNDGMHIINFSFVNVGFEPGRYIISRIWSEHKQFVLDGNNLVKNIGNPEQRDYQVNVGYPPSSILIYPSVASYFAQLRLPKDQNVERMVIYIDTFENKGKSKQVFILSIKNTSLTIEKAREDFSSYLM